MAFTQVTVTGVVQLQNAQPASGAVVSFLLSEEISDGSTAVYPQALTTRCASDGSFSITVNALDDDTTNPKGAFYAAKITYGPQQLGSLQVVVSAADAPSVDLYSLLAPSGSPASGVTQLQAGDGISLDPGSGLGIVTITATGGGGGSIDSVTGDSPINAETVDGAVTLSMVEDAYDAYGAAATAQSNAETFATDAIAALDLGTASTHAATDFDPAGSASTAQSNAETYAAEQAAAAEAAAKAASLPLAGGTMSGAIAMGSSKITGLADGSEDSDAAAFGQIPTALPPNGTAGGSLTGTYPNPTVATIPSGATGTTQSPGDDSTKLSTTAYTDAAVLVEKDRAEGVEADLAPIIENVNTVASSGAAQTIPASTSDTINYLTLTADCTLTFPTAEAGESFLLALEQDATGSRTVTWPGTVKWPSGTAPTLTTTASKTDVFSMVCVDGTSWLGFVVGQDF